MEMLSVGIGMTLIFLVVMLLIVAGNWKESDIRIKRLMEILTSNQKDLEEKQNQISNQAFLLSKLEIETKILNNTIDNLSRPKPKFSHGQIIEDILDKRHMVILGSRWNGYNWTYSTRLGPRQEVEIRARK